LRNWKHFLRPPPVYEKKTGNRKKKKKNKKQKMSIVLLTLLGAVAAQTYHSEVLDMMGKYTLHWGITNTTLELKVVVNATGWVGFGLSPTGGMKGSDIVMGWINADGSKSFSDRFAPENDVPVVDPVQSYTAARAERGQWPHHDALLAQFGHVRRQGRAAARHRARHLRLLRRQAGQRRAVQARLDESRHAFGQFAQSRAARHRAHRAHVHRRLHVFKNAVAPGSYGRTRYWWRAFKFPQTTKHHIVGYEPIVPLAEISQTHHMLVYLCHGAFDNATLNYVGPRTAMRRRRSRAATFSARSPAGPSAASPTGCRPSLACRSARTTTTATCSSSCTST
jgi:hypothetical protein